jgi:hypothetical protein
MATRLSGSEQSIFDRFGVDLDEAKDKVKAIPKEWSKTKIAVATVGSVALPIGLWLLLRTPCAPCAEHGDGAKLVVKTPTGGHGNLRAAPGIKSRKVTEIPNGASVHVLGSALDGGRRWYNVDAGEGRTGWMHSDILLVTA